MSNDKSAEEIVRGLLEHCNYKVHRHGERWTKVDIFDLEQAAAKITELNDFASIQCAKLLERVAELESQLAASQQRERAAVEDLDLAARETQEGVGVCVVCKHYPEDMGHGMPSICDECAGSEHCMFEWRGPQEAGEEIHG